MTKKGFTLTESLLVLAVGIALISTALAVYLNFARPTLQESKELIVFLDFISSCQQYSSILDRDCYPKNEEKVSEFLGENYLAKYNLSYTCSESSISISRDAVSSSVAKKSAPLVENMIKESFVQKVDVECSASGSSISCEIKPSTSFCCL